MEDFDSMSATSATTRDMSPLSLETLTKAMREIELMPNRDQWIVVDPHGRMYKGKVEDVIHVLLAEHPLLKMPKMFGSE